MARKATKKEHVTVRVNPLTLVRIDKLADRKGISRSAMIDRALEEYADRHDSAQADAPKPHTRRP